MYTGTMAQGNTCYNLSGTMAQGNTCCHLFGTRAQGNTCRLLHTMSTCFALPLACMQPIDRLELELHYWPFALWSIAIMCYCPCIPVAHWRYIPVAHWLSYFYIPVAHWLQPLTPSAHLSDALTNTHLYNSNTISLAFPPLPLLTSLLIRSALQYAPLHNGWLLGWVSWFKTSLFACV